MARAKYDSAAIARTFKHIAVNGPVVYYGQDVSPPNRRHVFKVVLAGEMQTLTVREAWLVALALADGRRNGLRTASKIVEEEVPGQGASPEWLMARFESGGR